MDLSRAAYSRDLKITVMRALDAGCGTGELARKYPSSPKLVERWCGECAGGRCWDSAANR